MAVLCASVVARKRRAQSRANLERVMGCSYRQMHTKWGSLVVGAAKPYLAVFPSWYSREDVVGLAWEGFWRAALSYQPSLGYDFRSYAFLHVRHYLIDILRVLVGKHHSPKAKACAVPTVSLDVLMAAEVEPGECAPVVHEDVESMLSILTKQEREVMTRIYLKGQTLGECGAWMGFTESRAQQIKKKALNKLKARFGPADV